MNAQFIVSSQLSSLLGKLKTDDFEKTIPYMYVDTVGKVTVGIGHNLTDKGDVLKLPFIVKRMERRRVRGGDCGIPITDNKTVDRPATPAEIQNDYDFLVEHTGLGHYAAAGLAKYTTLELSQEAMDVIFADDLQKAINASRGEFGTDNFVNFPVTCQAALIDIAFNCGSFRSFQGHFAPAIKGQGGFANLSMAERWRVAAQHCRRGAVNEARNNCVMSWFITGATECEAKRQ